MVMNGLMVDYRAVWFYLGIQGSFCMLWILWSFFFVGCEELLVLHFQLWSMGLCYLVFVGKAKHSVLFCFFIIFFFIFCFFFFFEVGDFMGCLIFFYEIVTLCVFLGLILMTLSSGCLAGKILACIDVFTNFWQILTWSQSESCMYPPSWFPLPHSL
jgi:hypothetical protein